MPRVDKVTVMASGKRFLFYTFPVLICLFSIFALSSIPHHLKVFQWVFSLDKFAHTIEYYVLGYLLMRIFATSPHRIFSRAPAVFVIILGVLCGISDEWNQSLVPGRDASIHDILFDLLGIVLAGATYRFVRHNVMIIKRAEDMIQRF